MFHGRVNITERLIQMETASNLHNKPVPIYTRSWNLKESKKVIVNRNKGQWVVETNDQPRREGTQHLNNKNKRFLVKQLYFSRLVMSLKMLWLFLICLPLHLISPFSLHFLHILEALTKNQEESLLSSVPAAFSIFRECQIS